MKRWPEHNEQETIDDHLSEITRISERAAAFWARAHGWAPDEAAEALSDARLDRLASFSRTLRARVQEVQSHPDEPADLILAWGHLRTLAEGNLKLFLSVFLTDYMADDHAPRYQNGSVIPPHKAKLEGIRLFLIARGLLSEHQDFIANVQQRGNTLRAFGAKDIGTAQEYLGHIPQYRDFIFAIDSSLPLPDVSR